MKRSIAILFFCLSVFTGFSQSDVMITEVMASNTRTLADEDGDFPDWVEIYNAGTSTVNLGGWFLADRNNEWQFPLMNLPPKTFLVVFASNKNRKIVGRPLHTNFRLDGDDSRELIALLRPDRSVVSRFAFASAPQVADISYGVGVSETPTTLVTTGASARLLVPQNDSLGLTWTSPEFSDSGWTAVNNGIGFESSPPSSSATIIANSVADFSDTQGANNWMYGYWNKGTDADGIYDAATEFIPFPRGTGNTLNETNYWNGTSWNWAPPADPPWTELTASGGHPAGADGVPGAATHWAVRRYISETNGQVRLTGILACNSQNGTCGDGTIGRIYVDGVQVFQRTAFGDSRMYSLLLNVSLGSYIDFVIDPGAAENDFCDSTTFTAIVRTAGDTAVVADTVADWSDTGQQGYKNWTYGVFIKTNAALTYAANRFAAFPSSRGPHSANNYWNGEFWQWFDGDPPFDRISQFTAQPNIGSSTSSSTNALEHWVIRRWVSEIAGTLHIDWHMAKKDLTGSGMSARLLRNGTPVGTPMTIAAADFVGSNRTDIIANVQVGDLIDFTVEPNIDVVGDICFFSAAIHGMTTLSNQFNTDVSSAMANVNAGAYLRIPFTVAEVSAVNTLSLRVKYDDGFRAYLNGGLAASGNAPDPAAWDSTATTSRIDAQSSQYEEFDLTAGIADFIRSGENVLAIHGLNSSSVDPDFLVVAQLHAGIGALDTNNVNYFYTATPGSPNGFGSTVLGPLITDVSHTPHDPADNEDLIVTARIIQVREPVTTVRLYYRVMFGAEANVTMFDDGTHWDGVAGDGVYGASIANTLSGPGQMVRYYITATDSGGGTTREPSFPHPLFSSQYFGSVVKNPSLTNPLEVLHMFITDANWNSANTAADGRFACSIYYLGEFYDNLGMNRHGQSSQGGKFIKKSFDVDFNPDHGFRWDPNEDRVDDINLLTTLPDKGHFRNILAYETLRDAGAPYHFVVPIRMQTNGAFCGIWHIVENGDDRYLSRVGKDPRGSLYKMYNRFQTAADAAIAPQICEKKTRREEGNADLLALLNGVNALTLQARTNYMWDNVNIAATINTFAARAVTSEHDCCHKNYYFYRDSDITGEWEAMAWDMDLSFGRNWSGATGIDYFDANVYTNNSIFGNWIFTQNRFFDLLLNGATNPGNETTRRMYLRRARTLADELQQTNGTPASELYFENRLAQLEPLLTPDAALDLAKYGTWGAGQTSITDTNSPFWQTLAQALNETRTNYMVNRRSVVFNNRWNIGADFPNAQPPDVVINVGAIDYNPASGNQDEEYIQLINTNNIEVDISHWKLGGAVEHTFQGGVVLPRNGGSVYVVPNKRAFRARATPPRAGMGLFVEGAYRGQLSARGETIYLSNKIGRLTSTNEYRLISSNQYIGNPTPAQNSLRVTEIMYHPTALPTDAFPVEEYEYIELRNIGATALNLNGVRFSRGIEFRFGNMLLNPDAYVLVVKNIIAFESRYGPDFNIAGQYIGSLDNGGENIEIEDRVGEKVQDFSYNNSWYPITDGAGASLVIVDDRAYWDSWGLKQSWRPSTYDGGTPGQGDPPPIEVVPVLVSEVLSNSEFPEVDKIELHNTNTVIADIGGWFISDDFEEPKKFRIPDGTTIAPGDFIVFDETQFNPDASSTSFAFSSLGDEAYLFSGDGTNITGYFHGFEFGGADTGVSFVRFVVSLTNEYFVASSTNTFGETNAYPKVDPVVISEIMYYPAPDGTDNSWQEFVEIHNLTTNTVPLYEPSAPTNTWRLRGGVDFDFPEGQNMEPGAYALVVSFNPTNTALLNQFRAWYKNLSPSIAIYGPYDGQLENDGEELRLRKPGPPVIDEATGDELVPSILVDAVEYDNDPPWPFAAAGIGPSLQRRVISNFGNDPLNWAAALSPGGPFGGTPPEITVQPVDQLTIERHTITLAVSASGTQPLYYQWRHNSNNIPGGNSASLELPNIRLNQAGWYNVIIYNSAGSVESAYCFVTVQHAPHIRRQPQSVAVRTGNNAMFSVVADSQNTPNLTYQWWFRNINGQNSIIANATSASYTVVSVQLTHAGHYFVTVGDGVDTITSELAELIVLVDPAFVQLPISQYVPRGSSATFSVVARDDATLPLTNYWRRAGGSGPARSVTNVVYRYVDFMTVTNVQGSNAFEMIIQNQARPLGIRSLPYLFFVAPIVDNDQDGLPDQWETDTGLTEPAEDYDRDTMSNLAEYIAGTDPKNPESYLNIEELGLGEGASIEFMALSNKTYTVESTDDLTSGIWRRVRDVYATSNSAPVTVIDPTFSSNRFYRLATPKKP